MQIAQNQVNICQRRLHPAKAVTDWSRPSAGAGRPNPGSLGAWIQPDDTPAGQTNRHHIQLGQCIVIAES